MKKLQSLNIDAFSGKYVARSVEEDSLCGFQFYQNFLSDTWIINHNRNFTFFLFSIFSGEVEGTLTQVMPNKIEVIDDNSIMIEFDSAIKGIANFLYYVNDVDECTLE